MHIANQTGVWYNIIWLVALIEIHECINIAFPLMEWFKRSLLTFILSQ